MALNAYKFQAITGATAEASALYIMAANGSLSLALSAFNSKGL
jgi:hypothetical protein